MKLVHTAPYVPQPRPVAPARAVPSSHVTAEYSLHHYAEHHNSMASRYIDLIIYAFLFAATAYIAEIYHLRLVNEIDHYQDSMPNNSIPLPPRSRLGNNSRVDGWTGLKQTETALIDWQEAFLSFRSEITVCLQFVVSQSLVEGRPNSLFSGGAPVG
jgi:hypothetical protein